MKGRTPRVGKLEGQKKRLAMLLERLEREGIAIPLVEGTTQKSWRSRGAGAAQDKKRERKASEAQMVAQRIEQLEELLRSKRIIEMENGSCSSDDDDT